MPQTHAKLSPKRRRAGGKRSKLGCRTCRIRHIKCDETPVSCRNCTDTGRCCEGYYQCQLPRKRGRPQQRAATPTTLPLISLEFANGRRGLMTADERRCFAYFQNRTIPAILGFFDSVLWQKLVLQVSQAEPAVYHAVIALSAVHTDAEMKGMTLADEALENNQWKRFALEQSGRSFNLLTQRRNSQDPQLTVVILLCCLLFVVQELLQGQYKNAFKHLRSGLRILKESQIYKQQSIDAFNVDNFRIGGPLLCIDKGIEDQAAMFVISSVQEGRQAFDIIASAVFRFLEKCWSMSDAEIANGYSSLDLTRTHLLSQASHVEWLFHHFCEDSYARLNLKDQRGADILNLLMDGLSLALETCLLQSDDASHQYYTPRYKNQLSMAESIIGKLPERPSITLDVGVIPALYLVAVGCDDYGVRWQAIQALQAWPHREGSFDSTLLARIAAERMKNEPCSNDHSQHTGPELSPRKVLVAGTQEELQARINMMVRPV
ncbi:Zn(II)2Cys6 transcription factor [Aspergillus tanneri]|uniref:Zn(2)-C6 fungal-type domain-containing protein n=1 Tax=Aspergillus tanneri TaxID=1220188 RepID=A0A5M9MIM8_9EURO|nr:uncharacterized protein ATNIH1004_009417 [Aspergillus tanneri]KAA8645200.1 hypothetical protein ATNIH1004_009417 [Aspergillus tanneri]